MFEYQPGLCAACGRELRYPFSLRPGWCLPLFFTRKTGRITSASRQPVWRSPRQACPARQSVPVSPGRTGPGSPGSAPRVTPERPVRHRVAEHVPAVAHQHVGRALRRHSGRGLVPQSGRDHSKHLRVRCRGEEHARRRHCSEQVLEQHVQPTPGRSRHD
jgi:hypothetical protein